MNPTIEAAANQILGALLTGGAYGLLLVLAVWVALKLARRSNASTRHAAWFVTLLTVASLPAILLLAPALPLVGQPRTVPTPADESTPHTQPATPFPVTLASGDLDEPSDSAPLETLLVSEPLPDEAAATPADEPTRWQLPARGSVSVGVVGLLLVLALIRLAGLTMQVRELARLKRGATQPDATLQEVFDGCVIALNSSRQPRLLLSGGIPAPMVVGYFRPAVLLPTSLIQGTTPAQLGHILRHELAHLARRDDWANLVQQVMVSVYFFHPGIRIISRRLAAEREIACDDHALAGALSPRDYALLLTEFAGRMKGRGFTAAPAAWNKHSQLKERIDMILDRKRNTTPRVSRVGVGAMTLVTVGLALAALVTLPRVTLAGTSAETPTETPAAETATAGEAITLETRVDVDVDVAVEEVPRVEIRRVETRTGGPSLVVETTAAIEKPGAPPLDAIAGEPAPASAPAPHPAPTVIVRGAPPAPVPPTPVAATPPLIVSSGHPAPARIIVDRSGTDIERRLDRVERMLESLVGRDKAGASPRKKVETTQTLPPDVQKKVQAEVELAQREVDKMLRDMDVKGIEKRALESSLMASVIDSIQARQKELESRRRALDREAAALDRELERMKRDREHISEQREKAREEKRAGRDAGRPADRGRDRSEDPQVDEIKRRDTGEGKPTDPTVKY